MTSLQIKLIVFFHSFYLPQVKDAMLVEFLTRLSAFPVIDSLLNVSFFPTPEGFLIICNTLLANGKINFSNTRQI